MGLWAIFTSLTISESIFASLTDPDPRGRLGLAPAFSSHARQFADALLGSRPFLKSSRSFAIPQDIQRLSGLFWDLDMLGAWHACV